jgi:hypothetical protein
MLSATAPGPLRLAHRVLEPLDQRPSRGQGAVLLLLVELLDLRLRAGPPISRRTRVSARAADGLDDDWRWRPMLATFSIRKETTEADRVHSLRLATWIAVEPFQDYILGRYLRLAATRWLWFAVASPLSPRALPLPHRRPERTDVLKREYPHLRPRRPSPALKVDFACRGVRKVVAGILARSRGDTQDERGQELRPGADAP